MYFKKGKIMAKLAILILVLSIITTFNLVDASSKENIELLNNEPQQELALLFGESTINMSIPNNLSFTFNYSRIVPLNYGNQAPILFKVNNESLPAGVTYQILNDTHAPNKIINFTITPEAKGENISIHLKYWVLVKNKDYADLPMYVKIPKENELPEETKTWLSSTANVQCDNILIKLKAKQLKGLSNNIIKLSNRVVLSTCYLYHKPRLEITKNIVYPLAYKITGDNTWLPLSDALSALILRGNCYAGSHLSAALFRANGVPARSIIITPTPTYGRDIGVEQHVIAEYYCPDYGWIPAETEFGLTPPYGVQEFLVSQGSKLMGLDFNTMYESKSYIVLRINHPDDENKAGNGFSFYGGMEAYHDFSPRECYSFMEENCFHTYGWIQKEEYTDTEKANILLNLTKDVYELNTKYIGMTLNGEDSMHFINATIAQENAIQCFKNSDITGYQNNMTIACEEYMRIE